MQIDSRTLLYQNSFLYFLSSLREKKMQVDSRILLYQNSFLFFLSSLREKKMHIVSRIHFFFMNISTNCWTSENFMIY